jgi:hypothetical protein
MAKAKGQTDFGNFKPVEEANSHRLLIRSWGWDKVGKNHFGYTMPDPILGLYLDPGGAEGVANKFIRGEVEGFPKKDIRAIQYRFNKKFDDQDKAIELREQWIEDYRHALTVARSIQIDETEFWELCRFAEFGKESDLQREYGPLNGMYRGLIQDAYDAGVNLQLIQKVKDEWVGGKSTGGMVPQGFRQAGNIVQVSLEHTWGDEDGFQVKIVKCRQNTAIWGMSQENLTFPQLGVLVYDDTTEEDWQ